MEHKYLAKIDSSGDYNVLLMVSVIASTSSVGASVSYNICNPIESVCYIDKSIDTAESIFTKQFNFTILDVLNNQTKQMEANRVYTTVSTFIKKAYNTRNSRPELFKLYDDLYSLVKKNDFLAYQKVLDEINLSLISMELIIGLLRIPFLYRYKIENWSLFLNKSKQEIEKRDPKKVKLLAGLI